MSRKSKLVFSLVSLCFSIAVLCFGVYSALSVSYSISGNVSYEINDVFVELDLSVYRAMSTTPVNSATHNQNVSTIKDAGDNISETDFGKLSYTDHESTYEGEVVKPGNEDGIFEADSPNLTLTYGSPTEDNQGYAFYIVIDIHNLGSEIINAQITAPTSLENTILRDSGNVEITANGTERIVLGLALDDVTKGITSADFTYTITISRGELPEAEPITDMEFAFNEENKTATLTSYAGSGGDVVIPETIGYDTTSSKTLTFETMEDMTSNEMYFCQDLYITLPNQEAQLIENPMLWFYGNMGSIQETPQNYFPMTIQTVESYTIDQEDFNEYAALDQDAAMMVAIMPIQMIIEGLCNSVDVQYGTDGQSFTFNMENYNAAVNEGDNSPTSEAIRDFMSKAESNLESLLPVTFSNFEYGFAVKGKEYFVTSIGEDAFSGCSNLTSIEIPSSVTSIGNYAFYSCSNLTSIEIPSGVTSIGDNAFSGCSNLTSIDIPSSVKSIGGDAFYRCSSLETVTFGEDSKLASISSSAFSGCSNLTSIEIPSSVTSIGSSAFFSCYALVEVYNYSTHIPEVALGSDANGNLGRYAKVVYNPSDLTVEKPTRIQTIGNVQYYVYGEDFIALAPSVARGSLTTLTLDGRTTEINRDAFSSCSTLETVTFGANSQLGSIGEDAFSGCSNLTSIEIPSSVTSIGSSAFWDCLALKTVTFGEDSKLASISSFAFQNCFSLTSIGIPSSVTSIGSYAFSGCCALVEVYNYSTHIPEVALGSNANGYLGQYAKVVYNPSDLQGEKPATKIQTIGNVQYYVYGEDFIALAPSVARDSLTTLTLDGRTTEINRYAFSGCSNLTSIEIPSSVKSIGYYAFSRCSALKTVTFGDNSQLESIGEYAFRECSNLTSIEIPSSVTSIGDYAFYYCDALEAVTFGDADSVWVLNDASNTEISISKYTPQVLATYLTDTYYRYTWTKKQSA